MLIIVENTNGLNMTGKVKDNNNIGVLSITLIKNINRSDDTFFVWLDDLGS